MRLFRSALVAMTTIFLPTVLILPLAAAASVERHGHASPGKTPKDAAKATTNSCKACLERGVLLDPNLFAAGYDPEVKLGYEAAKKYPDMIDRIHCFCECKENAREHHKTLLTCFTSPHAAGCGVCLHEAIQAAKMKDNGASDDETEITVESLHKTEGHPPTFGRGI